VLADCGILGNSVARAVVHDYVNADLDAFIADETRRPCNQLVDVFLRLPAKRALEDLADGSLVSARWLLVIPLSFSKHCSNGLVNARGSPAAAEH
jgi:hypothetical protein